jgi:hypothetical protein
MRRLGLDTKTQNIFCFVNENLTTFLYTLKTEGEKKFSFLKGIPKSIVIKKIFGFLVFSIHIWYLAYPTDKSLKTILK